jgi:4-amino-4-deoxy-L-arabinose transferase-like glycosyltransferase
MTGRQPMLLLRPFGPPEAGRPILLRIMLLSLPAVLTLILALCFWRGMQATDDLGYAMKAMRLLGEGPPTIDTSHHRGRIGLTWPLAIIFSIFGVSDFSLSLLPLFGSVMTTPLVVLLGRHFFGWRVGFIAGLLYALFPLSLNYATFFVPEPILSFELSLASLLFLNAMSQEGQTANLQKLLAGILIGIAYLTTEAGALMLPVFFFYLLVARQLGRQDGWLMAGFMMVLLLELLYSTAFYGHPLYRFTALGGGYINDPMLVSANQNLTSRLIKGYPSLFVLPNFNFGLFGPLMIAGGIYGLVHFRRSSFFLIWSIVILIFYNFMSVRMDRYVVLPVASRLILPACIPLLILSAKLLIDLWRWITARLSSLIALKFLSRAIYLTGLMALVSSSPLALYLTKNTGLTAILARNAELASAFLEKEPRLVLVADRRSGNAIHFFRRFNPQDSILGFQAASQLLYSGPREDLDKPLFIVLNGPIVYEKEIFGGVYGGSRTVNADDREFIDRLLISGKQPVFSAQFRKAPLFETLMNYRIIRHLMGSSRHQSKQRLFAQDSSLGQIQIFRLTLPFHELGWHPCCFRAEVP